MAIVGLTDFTDVWQALPEIARIRKGEPKGQSKFPKDLDHFRVVFNDEYLHLADTFEEMYGEQPKELGPLTLLSGNIENIAWMEAYQGEKLNIRCDREKMVKSWNEERGAYDYARKPCGYDKETKTCSHGCDQTARLNVILPEFLAKTGEVGYFTVITGSTADFMHIFAAINLYNAKFREVTRVPFMLSRVKRRMNTVVPDKNGKGQRLSKEYSLLSLKILPEYAKLMFDAMPATIAALAAPESTSQAQLPAAAGAENIAAGDVEAAKKALGTGDKPRRLAIVAKPEAEAETVEGEVVADWREDIDARGTITEALKDAGFSAEYALEHLIPDQKLTKFSDLPLELYPTVAEVVKDIKKLRKPTVKAGGGKK